MSLHFVHMTDFLALKIINFSKNNVAFVVNLVEKKQFIYFLSLLETSRSAEYLYSYVRFLIVYVCMYRCMHATSSFPLHYSSYGAVSLHALHYVFLTTTDLSVTTRELSLFCQVIQYAEEWDEQFMLKSIYARI